MSIMEKIIPFQGSIGALLSLYQQHTTRMNGTWHSGFTRLLSIYSPFLPSSLSLWIEYQPQTHFNLCRMARDQNAKSIGCYSWLFYQFFFFSAHPPLLVFLPSFLPCIAVAVVVVVLSPSVSSINAMGGPPAMPVGNK